MTWENSRDEAGLSIHLNRIALLLLGSALFLSGLIFMPRAQHVFWAPEAFSARVLGPMAALLLLAAALRLKSEKSEAPRPGLQAGKALAFLLIGLWFVSAAFAHRSDLAGRELAIWLAAPLCFVAAWMLGREATARAKILYFIFAAAALQALYGVIQSAGWEPALASWIGPASLGFDKLNWAVSFGGRAGGFLGNPNFLGGHLAMLLPLSMALAMDGRSHGWRRTLRWLLCVLLAAGLVVSQTRGAWLGAGFGIALLLLACRLRMPGLITRNKKELLGLAVAALAAAAVFLATHSQNLERFKSIFSGDSELQRRMVLMQSSLNMALEHPLLGVGPGNFRIHFPSVQSKGLSGEALATQPFIVSEHAHNDLIQMAAECGFAAALLLLLLWAWCLAALWKGSRISEAVERAEGKHHEPLLVAGVMGGLAALMLHGMANFPFLIAPTQMTAWVIAALGLRLALPEADAAAAPPQPPRRGRLAALAVAALLLFAFSAFDAGRLLVKDALWWVAEGEFKLGNVERSETWLSRTLQLDRQEDRLWQLHGQTQLRRGFTGKAIESFNEAVRLNPHDYPSRISLARALLANGKYAEAEAALALAATNAPNLFELWEPLGAALYMQAKYDEAVKAWDQAAMFNADSASMLENKSAALGNLGRFDEAIQALDKAESKEPGRAKNQVNRAITYYKMGLKPLAARHLNEAARRDPNDPQIKELRKVIR